ncbi:MAG TPA: amino acid adenylation domain-containing protein, partial [Thermoanaerobaculia bacterium]
ATGPLAHTVLLRLGGRAHVLVLVVHHIVADGWSLGVGQRDLAALYRAALAGTPSLRPAGSAGNGGSAGLPPLPIQYADFADWQRSWIAGEESARQVAYWKEQLRSLPSLDLRGDRPRPPFQTFSGAYVPLELAAGSGDALGELARRQGVTLFMALLAGFQVLLGRYTQQDDFAVGALTANRNRAELEDLIGVFINNLALRVDLAGDPRVADLLAHVRDTTLAAYAHQELPFERLLEELHPERDLSRGALIQAMFNLLNFPGTRERLPGLTLSSAGVKNERANFDVMLWMIDEPGRLSGWLEYNSDLFDASTARRMADHFARLVETLATDPAQRISALPLLSAGERQQLLADLSRHPGAHDWQQCIHHLFERQAAATPGAPAVAFAGRHLSYGELNERANRLARRLRGLGVGPEVRVGICMHKSLDLPVAVLAALKAGGCYVPMDATYSSDRLSFLLSDARIGVLLTQEDVVATLPEVEAPRLCVDADWPSIATEDGHDLPAAATGVLPTNLAYVIYTSGSTGKPKGAMIEHRSLVNAYLAWEESYRLRQDTTSHLQMASFSFDVWSGDFVRALCSGAKLVLCPRDTLLEPEKLIELMEQERVDCAEFVPAVMRGVMEQLKASGRRLDPMRLLAVGSDAWYVEESLALLELCGPQTRLVNSYGVTEVTIDSTFFELAPGSGAMTSSAMVPIGRPFANQEVFVLDGNLGPVPVGLPGELCLGGAGVARGYLDRPDLTATKFVPHPASAEAGQRMYRTGDLARWLPSGDVEFLGRLDHQVKVRGFRIEPGEIESVLGEHPAVRQAVVVVLEQKPGDKHLVAYVVPRELPDGAAAAALATEVRTHVKEKLPEYMVPSAFVILPELPLTPNGKVDRRALPAPDWSATVRSEDFVAPRTAVEELVAEIWKEVLHVERVGAFDNFFERGGHSLIATQVVSKIRQSLEVDLPLRTLFESRTLAELALEIEEVLITRLESLTEEEMAELL